MFQQHTIACPECQGSGHTLCFQCEGVGLVRDWDGSEDVCSMCAGAGQASCHQCVNGLVMSEQPEPDHIQFGGYGATGEGCLHFEGLGQFCNNCGKSYSAHGT